MLDGSDLNAASSKPSTPPSNAEAAADEQEQESEHIDYNPVPTTVSMAESHSSTNQAIESPTEGGEHSTSRATLLADYRTHVKVERLRRKNEVKKLLVHARRKAVAHNTNSQVKSVENIRRRSHHKDRIFIHHGGEDAFVNSILQVKNKESKKSFPRFKLPKIRNRHQGDMQIHDISWAAKKIQNVMRRHIAVQVFRKKNFGEGELAQSGAALGKKLFEECCKCNEFVKRPIVSSDGNFRIAGPNLSQIRQLLKEGRSSKFLDLLQPNGVAQLTALHAAAQRGYKEVSTEIIESWLKQDLRYSPHEPYSITALGDIFIYLKQMRGRKKLLCEGSHENYLRNLVNQLKIGDYSHFRDGVDKLLLMDETIELTLSDIVKLCGHPLVLSIDSAGNTPLHYAAEGGYLPLCELFLDYGANINQQNSAGETPLHFAISSMHEDVCHHFVHQGADVNLSRYVQLTLLNNITLSGTIVDTLTEEDEFCKVFPISRSNSNAMKRVRGNTEGNSFRRKTIIGISSSFSLIPTWVTNFFKPGNTATATRSNAGRRTVSPGLPTPEINQAKAAGGIDARLPSVITVADGIVVRIKSLEKASPIFRGRKPRDIIYFRTSPGKILARSNKLCAFVIEEHLAISDALDAREEQARTKLLHLLIRFVPHVATHAINNFRTPLFRCTLAKGVRSYRQRWILNNNLHSKAAKREKLLLAMQQDGTSAPLANKVGLETRIKLIQTAGMLRIKNQEHQRLKRLRRRKCTWNLFLLSWRGIKKVWKTTIRLWRFLSIQTAFETDSRDTNEREDIIGEPKGILYEYVYDSAEFGGGVSPTLDLILKTERKELMYHPWVTQLMDHKWNSFARRKLRHEFRIYFLYFVSYFISTYLDVGDTLVGMPVGGYSSPISFRHPNWQENLRDLGKVTCSIINAYYTVQEYRSYRKCGSLRTYFRDGWNWFDILQICCVWLLFGTEIAALSNPNLLTTDAYELVVTEESYYNRRMWRRYKLRTTLLSIVGPQIFIKWIQFARGNQVFGPFVRMIFKMFRDILVFFIVFCVFLFGFAFAFFILQLEGFRSYLSAITSVFQLSVGSWDWESIYEGGPIAIVFFFLYTLIGTIMLLNLLIAMLGNTYDNIWEDRLLFFELERAKATLAIQTSLNDDEYDERYWCRRLYVLEGDAPIEGIQLQKF